MANANFVVSSLPAYVATNKDLLLKNFALPNAGTRARMSIQTGVKKDAYINFLDMSPALADGTDCTFTAGGSATLTQREISTAVLKSDMEICPRNLIGKYAEYLVRVNATEESLPFEQFIMDGVVAELNKKIEKLIWLGDTTKSSDANLKWTNGLIKIAQGDADVVDVAIAKGTTAFDAIQKVYMAMTDEAIARGGEIYVSPALYRQFLQELMAKNLFHYASAEAEYPEEFYFPATNVKVVSTYGLTGDNLHIYASFAKNQFYGCDMEGDNEDIDLWYSRDNRTFRLEALWNSGVQIAFPEHVVLGTIATA